tara:strand:+ start:687 stop:1169 length:483 start_codon:yes stop_codon:yes gene_type:complete
MYHKIKKSKGASMRKKSKGGAMRKMSKGGTLKKMKTGGAAMKMTTVNGRKVPAFAADGKGAGDLRKKSKGGAMRKMSKGGALKRKMSKSVKKMNTGGTAKKNTAGSSMTRAERLLESNGNSKNLTAAQRKAFNKKLREITGAAITSKEMKAELRNFMKGL